MPPVSSKKLYYVKSNGEKVLVGTFSASMPTGYSVVFSDFAYKKLIFSTPPSGDLLEWLEVNATKQPADQAIQTGKSITITSNGTATITPDAPYDAMGKIDVTVNVSGSGGDSKGYSVTFPATAASWSNLRSGKIFLSDATTIEMADYSTIAGKTIQNVVAFKDVEIEGSSSLAMRCTLSKGEIYCLYLIPFTPYARLTTAPGATYATMTSQGSTTFIPMSDVVLSAIEIYDTD